MMVIKSISGTKQVRITNNDGTFRAMYAVNCDNSIGDAGDIQISKSFATLVNAERWARKMVV